MFRNLFKSAHKNIIHNYNLNKKVSENVIQNRNITHVLKHENFEANNCEKSLQFEERSSRSKLIKSIVDTLNVSKNDAIKLIMCDKKFRNVRVNQLSKVFQTLFEHGVHRKTIFENHFVMIMSHGKTYEARNLS